jgi:hypothetical protein
MEKRTFSITAAKSVITLDAKRAAAASLTVTNTSDKPATGQLKLRPVEAPAVAAAQPAWFAPLADTKFAPQATTQVTAKFAVPVNVAPGKYGFRLDAISTSNPDDDLTEGPLVVLEVPAAEVVVKKGFPWWIVIVAGVVLLTIGAVTWLLSKSKPAEKSKTAATAKEAVWVSPAKPGEIPAGTVLGGREHPPGSEDLYVCHAAFNNGVHPGKYRPGFGGCNVPWGGIEHTVQTYQLLTGDVAWVSASDGSIPAGAIKGGQEAAPAAQALYVCRANYSNGVHPGKTRPEFKGCHISWGGKEINLLTYEVLTTKP